MKDQTRKAPRAGTAEGIGQPKIERVAGQPAKQISKADPSHQAAGPAHERGIRQAENDGDLAGLVLKYFAEEITQALIEVQELLEREQNMTEKTSK